LEQYFAESLPSISPAHVVLDALAVGQLIHNGADERVILFVKLGDGERLSKELENAIRTQVRVKRSARHVPERVSLSQFAG
jgi:acetoacetyl-CoA synthetase